LSTYGAVGGGLGMVLLGVSIVYFADIDLPGQSFSLNFLYGATTCCLLTLGIGMADSISPLFADPGEGKNWRWHYTVSAVVLGTLFFAMANAFISSVQKKHLTSAADILSG